jgi:hypothetical protein
MSYSLNSCIVDESHPNQYLIVSYIGFLALQLSYCRSVIFDLIAVLTGSVLNRPVVCQLVPIICLKHIASTAVLSKAHLRRSLSATLFTRTSKERQKLLSN